MRYGKSPFDIVASGLELKDWVWYNQNNNTKFTKLASGMNKIFNLSDDKLYKLNEEDGGVKIVAVSK
ncbi:MAG: hypothetical protein J6Y78_15840 [Paludibacteraceae bacterium]|nr:hypothetical protein [Paludibacteraceae bacterium]